MRYFNFAKLAYSCFAVILLTAYCCPRLAMADIYRGYYTVFGVILTAREAAMGDCAGTNVGPDALFYNPGAYGVFFLDHDFEIAAPIPQKLLPGAIDDFRLFALNAGVRIDRALVGRDDSHTRNWSLAIGVSHIRTTLPDFARSWYPYSYDPDHMYSTGITVAAARGGRLRLGAGSTLKLLTADLTAWGAGTGLSPRSRHGVAFDIGLYADLDVFVSHGSLPNRKWSVVPSLSIVFANSGADRFSYVDPYFEDAIPHLIRYAASLKLTRWHEGREGMSLRGIYERDNWTGEYYEDKIGGEAGLANAFFLRAGKVLTQYDNERKPVTWGFGFSLKGFIDWARPVQSETAKVNKSIWSRCDLRFDFGHYKFDRDEIEANTNFFRVTLALKRL